MEPATVATESVDDRSQFPTTGKIVTDTTQVEVFTPDDLEDL